MIEARFDDLTGAMPSFRLTEPEAVIEATRIDEVLPVIGAAESAATRGSWVAGFVSYEAAPAMDPSLVVKNREEQDPFQRLPLAWFAVFGKREEAVLPRPRDDVSPPTQAWIPSTERADYDRAIASIREHIAAGDTYQVNHTLRLRSMVVGDERGLYRDMCYAQRGSHSAFINAGRFRILSASPELFFRLDENTVTMRPMKGTAPRGRWPQEDREVETRLRESPKEQAENAMIVDLLRNDLGRVARPGTVRWSDVFETERYETVWQLTSTVTAELRPEIGLPHLFQALFPSGSVTGAPKVSTMALIAGLEDSPRGVYCGSVGWIAPPSASGPRACFNVAIRTVMVDQETHTAEYGVGGGITWDSSAAVEYDETVAKARVLTTRRPAFDLIETMRRDPALPIRNLDLHIERLRESADYFGFALNQDMLRAELELHGQEIMRPSMVRLRLMRNGTYEIGLGQLHPMRSDDIVQVALDVERPVDPGDVFLFHKTTLRQTYEEARARHPEANDVVLTNARGEVTETTIANLAVKIDGRWLTPPLDCGLLPGIGRQVALAGGKVSEAPITIEMFRSAEEIALISDVRGWRAARLMATPSGT